jgi:VanZ like family
MQKFWQLAGWTLVVIITALSLVPPSIRPTTGAGGDFEHLLIFLAAGLAFAFGYRTRPWSVAIGLMVFSGTIELAQTFVPGRHARFHDFVIDSTAALLGLGIARVLARLMFGSGRNDRQPRSG